MRRPACSYLAAIVLSLLCTTAPSQNHPGSIPSAEGTFRQLSIAQTIGVPGQPASSMLLPARCDEEGNYYVRFFHGTSPQKEPIYKFDKDGVKKTVFSLPPAAEFQSKGTGTIDFAVARSGELYLLAAAVTGNHIVKFDKTGEFKSNIKLENDFNALRFDVFDSGTLLVSGVDRETSANLSPHAPYTGIFDQQGKLLKKVVLAEDKQYEEAADRGDSDFFDSTLGGGGNFAVERGSVVRGSDGNMYVVRWTNPAKVYAISATGEVIRSFDVTPELERKKPAGVREHAGRLAIASSRQSKTIRAQSLKS